MKTKAPSFASTLRLLRIERFTQFITQSTVGCRLVMHCVNSQFPGADIMTRHAGEVWMYIYELAERIS